jgi:hypothetical protein
MMGAAGDGYRRRSPFGGARHFYLVIIFFVILFAKFLR